MWSLRRLAPERVSRYLADSRTARLELQRQPYTMEERSMSLGMMETMESWKKRLEDAIGEHTIAVDDVMDGITPIINEIAKANYDKGYTACQDRVDRERL